MTAEDNASYDPGEDILSSSSFLSHENHVFGKRINASDWRVTARIWRERNQNDWFMLLHHREEGEEEEGKKPWRYLMTIKVCVTIIDLLQNQEKRDSKNMMERMWKRGEEEDKCIMITSQEKQVRLENHAWMKKEGIDLRSRMKKKKIL